MIEYPRIRSLTLLRLLMRHSQRVYKREPITILKNGGTASEQVLKAQRR